MPNVIPRPHRFKSDLTPHLSNALATVKIRSFQPNDLDGILEIQRVSNAAAAWGSQDYRHLAIDCRGMILVAKLEDQILPKVLGFSALYQMGEEAELWNIAVTPRYRRRGIAKSLLQEAFRRLSKSGAKRLFLEVRGSNTPAIELYHSIGFTLLARRKEYYCNPREDALVLVRKLALEP